MPPSTRRGVLAAVGGLCGLAGCGGFGHVADRIEASRILDPAAPDLDAAGFADYAARQRDRYGAAGVLGVDGDPLAPDGAFRGAWTAGVGLPADGGPDVSVPADHAVALYRVDGARRWWCWSAVAPVQPDGAGRTTVTAVENGLAGLGSVGRHAPAVDVGPGESPVRIGLDGGPAARFPLPAGRLAPAVGDGAFAVEWAGTRSGRLGVAGVCETDRDATPEWRVAVAAGRGTL